jgi:hypothetical protein
MPHCERREASSDRSVSLLLLNEMDVNIKPILHTGIPAFTKVFIAPRLRAILLLQIAREEGGDP